VLRRLFSGTTPAESTAADTCHSSVDGGDTRDVIGEYRGRIHEAVWVADVTGSLARSTVCCAGSSRAQRQLNPLPQTRVTAVLMAGDTRDRMGEHGRRIHEAVWVRDVTGSLARSAVCCAGSSHAHRQLNPLQQTRVTAVLMAGDTRDRMGEHGRRIHEAVWVADVTGSLSRSTVCCAGSSRAHRQLSPLPHIRIIAVLMTQTRDASRARWEVACPRPCAWVTTHGHLHGTLCAAQGLLAHDGSWIHCSTHVSQQC
jgi:microcystin-dependent protein